jgi:hypothetical protein
VGIGICPFTAIALFDLPVKLTIVSLIYKSYLTTFCATASLDRLNEIINREYRSLDTIEWFLQPYHR